MSVPQTVHIDNLYFSIDGRSIQYYYDIDGIFYDATNLELIEEPLNADSPFNFNVRINASQPIALILGSVMDTYIMLYQEDEIGRLIEITPRILGFQAIGNIEILKVPLPGGVPDEEGNFPALGLREVNSQVLNRLGALPTHFSNGIMDEVFDMIQNIGTAESRPPPPSSQFLRPESQPSTIYNQPSLATESYETLVRQLYGLPVQLPEFLIINGLRINFVSFQDVTNMQIERYIVDPLLQPWAGPPNTQNRIITVFLRNGITYLVKVRYNPKTNQIFPPV
ncbi:hypothetical protein BH23THE1_BH23THE1_32920 [soil metagenome]